MRGTSVFPVIGPLLLRRDTRKLATGAINGDSAATVDLIRIAITAPDPAARTIARQALAALTNQDSIETLCHEVLLHEDPVLRELALTRGYLPGEPGARALFLYMTGQTGALSRLDPDDYHPILAEGYRKAPAPIRSRAIRLARNHCWDLEGGNILARALLGTVPERAARTWVYEEWTLVMEVLASERSWDTLWQLTGLAPPALSLAALRRMADSGWSPGGDARQVFKELIGALPEQWNAPMPEKPLITHAIQESRVLRLSFSPDGSLLAAGSCDGSIMVWHVASARPRFSCNAGTGSPHFLAFTPDGGLLVAGGDRGTLQATGPSGEAIWNYEDPDHIITSAILSGTGTDVFAGDADGCLICIGSRTGRVRFSMRCHSFPVTALARESDGHTVVTGHADGTVCCVDAQTGVVQWTNAGTGDSTRTLGFLGANGDVLVICGHSLPVILSRESGEPVRTCAGHTGPVVCSASSPDGRTIVAGDDHNTVRIWQESKYPEASIPFYSRVPSICAIPGNGTCLVVCCDDGTVSYHHLPGGTKAKEFRAYRRPVSACSVSPDGSLLALAGWDGTLTLRSIPGGELLRTLRHPAGSVTALSPTGGDGQVLAGTAGGMVHVLSPDHEAAGRTIDLYTPSVRALTASGDGRILACSGKEPGLSFWDTKTGSLISVCSGLKTTVRCLAFLPDSKTCIAGGWDGIVRFWDIKDGTLRKEYHGHTSTISCCAVDPSGSLVVTGSNDTTARIWRTDGTGEPVVLRDGTKEVRCCAISPDGTLLATASQEPVLRLFYLPTGTRAGTIPQVPGTPTALAFSSDGLLLAAGYANGTLAFFPVHDRTLIRTLQAHAGAVTGIVAMPGGDCVVTGGEDGRVCTFRVPYRRALLHARYDDLIMAQGQSGSTAAWTVQWRFLYRLLSLRFQNDIELCPVFSNAGLYDIQIVGGC